MMMRWRGDSEAVGVWGCESFAPFVRGLWFAFWRDLVLEPGRPVQMLRLSRLET